MNEFQTSEYTWSRRAVNDLVDSPYSSEILRWCSWERTLQKGAASDGKVCTGFLGTRLRLKQGYSKRFECQRPYSANSKNAKKLWILSFAFWIILMTKSRMNPSLWILIAHNCKTRPDLSRKLHWRWEWARTYATTSTMLRPRWTNWN